jgi:hypothetical protein
MIYSARRILSGLAGFALLAMPVSAAAHDHRDVHHQSPPLATARPASAREWHPAVTRPSSAVGPHFLHPALGRPAVFNPRHKFDLPRTQVVVHTVGIGVAPVSRVATARVIGATLPPVRVPPSRVWRGRRQPPVSLPAVQVAQPMPPVMHPAWTHDQFDDDEAPPPRLWYVHHEADRDDYPARVCDEDGDDCEPVTRFRCDQDGDDCERVRQYRCDEDGDDCNRYGRPYPDHAPEYGRQYGVPSYYNGRPDLLSERQRLAEQLDYAQAQFHAARAAGERKLSARWASYIKNLNHRLATLDAQAAGAAYNFQPPEPYTFTGYPPVGSPYAPGYGANPYGTNPLGGMMNSLLGSFTGNGAVP